MSNDKKLCPFSKPIIGKWCRCQYATLTDRCAGKMHCQHPENHLETCHQLVTELENNTRFILGVSNNDTPLTHQQYMKIKCGGLQGMQRVLHPNSQELPSVITVTAEIIEQHKTLAGFPYNEIVQDIARFSHRKSSKKKISE
ncbi:MAG: hypothetical protein QNL62_12000 [Gammaproteobacteria bacterium]|nr:hypothetical protein [Gammaproteobacteria bacterium]